MHKDPHPTPTLYVQKWVQMGEGGSWSPPPENSEFGRLGWDGQLEKGNI